MRRWLSLYSPLVALVGLLASPSNAQDSPATNGESVVLLSKLKTAYLYNIAKFVSWQDEASETVLCVDDSSPLYSFVKELNNKPVADNRLLRISSGQAARCHIVFSDRQSDEEIQLNYEPDSWGPMTLAISDKENAMDEGYTIQLFMDDGRLRFAINADALANSEFRISSKLLRLSRNSPAD